MTWPSALVSVVALLALAAVCVAFIYFVLRD